MRELFVKYIINRYQDIPSNVFVVLATILCLGVTLILFLCGFKKGGRLVSGMMLLEYVLVLFCSTVIFRTVSESQGHDFRPFWSYISLQEGKLSLLPEIIMNEVAFVPVGLLVGCAFRDMTWWKVMLIGCVMSVMIEAMQYFLMRGFAEVDDVMHNTAGCLIGYGVYSLVRILFSIGKTSCAGLRY